jgi:hypothetical protein
MLTPKHRALFAAAYSSQLLRSSRDPREATPVPPGSAEGHDMKNDDQDRCRPTGKLPAA